jgi:hypothetical protein
MAAMRAYGKRHEEGVGATMKCIIPHLDDALKWTEPHKRDRYRERKIKTYYRKIFLQFAKRSLPKKS